MGGTPAPNQISNEPCIRQPCGMHRIDQNNQPVRIAKKCDQLVSPTNAAAQATKHTNNSVDLPRWHAGETV